MIVCAPVTSDEHIDPYLDRADWIVVAEVINGEIVSWQDIDVLWSLLHDSGAYGSHHDRIVKFLSEHRIEAIVANHMGDDMVRILKTKGTPVHLGATGNARTAVKTSIT